MGNNCVNGKIAEDGFLKAISHSIWPSESSSDMIAYNNNKVKIVGAPPVQAIEDPIPFHINPPQSMKIENEDRDRKPSQVPKTEQVIMIFTEKPKPKKPHNVKRLMSVGLQMDYVLTTKTGHLKERYNLRHELGQGQYGKTFMCVDRKTGKNYACKSIAKRKLLTQEDVDDVRTEIEIMHHLSGHPNVISIEGAYEDAVAVHVVMELCRGGELFDRIVKRGRYSEKKAAKLTRKIVGVVENCHSLGVMHRDLKPENFLFLDEDDDSDIKTIDFGLSVFFKPGEIFTDVVGSPYYVAPEVLCKRYGPEADVWSAGVIVYILLCGVPPFWGDSEQEIFEEVLCGDIDFSSGTWLNISESAKDLVKKMLVRDPKRRITAHQVLCHPWVQVDGVAHDKLLDSAVLSRLMQFSDMDKLKKMTLRPGKGTLPSCAFLGRKQTQQRNSPIFYMYRDLLWDSSQKLRKARNSNLDFEVLSEVYCQIRKDTINVRTRSLAFASESISGDWRMRMRMSHGAEEICIVE
ncbi:hypothetical protein DH2020_018264 [Rehmannia glutinosa]|uniref:Protein kinase domain-containing protein n=1 Tax=Rehmannia glutinosa TaxID=99300 RepID=A0ABR0WIT6_REHGL